MRDSTHPQGSLAFLPEIERRMDSLYTALDTLLVTEQFETALQLVGSIYPYWETYENLSDGVAWLYRLAGQNAEERFGLKSLSILYSRLANLLRHQGEYRRAITYYELGLACLREQSDYKVYTFLLSGLGEIAFRQGRYEEATGFYESYLEISQQMDDKQYVADAYNALGRLATVKGNFSAALEYHESGQRLCEENDYPTGLAWMFNALGELERVRGKYAKSAEYFRESAAIFDRLGNRGAQMLALQNLAFAILHDYPSRSEPLFRRTMSFWSRGPAKHGMSLSIIGLSRVDMARGNMKKASRQISLASQLLDQIGVRLELGDRVDYEIALKRIKKETGHDPLHFEGVNPLAFSGNSQLHSSVKLPKGLTLTKSELGILSLAAQGLSDKQIAVQLVISPHTVNAHLKSIYRKLSVKNRTAAVAMAKSRHII